MPAYLHNKIKNLKLHFEKINKPKYRNIFYILIIFVLIFIFVINPIIKYRKMFYIANSPQSWITLEHNMKNDFYYTKEAKRIGENILFFQTYEGGWRKDICMQNKINAIDKFYYKNINKFWDATVDNYATTTEIDYLAKLYKATNDDKYKIAIIKGINYLITLQYDNGGFPQISPLLKKKKYRHQITYNDETMVNILKLFRQIYNNDNDLYNFKSNFIKEKTRKGYNKGIKLILKTQLPSGMWAAQYNKTTLKPCSGRMYEPSAIDTRESAYIVLFLMSIDNPSDEIINSIEKSVKWFKTNEIKNKTTILVKEKNKKYIKLTDCKDCKPIWARLYDLNNEKPIFSDKTGIIRYDISDISIERAQGYEWYIETGNLVIENYNSWKQKVNSL
jgi:pectinesterase